MKRYCLRCGKEFETVNPIMVFCSQTCIKEEVKDKNQYISKKCRICDSQFNEVVNKL